MRIPAVVVLSLVVAVSACGGDRETPSEPEPATGDLEVSAATSGEDLDSDGYEISVDGSQTASIGVNGSTTFTDLSAGDHDVELSGVAENCSVQAANPKTVTVPDGGSASTSFSVECQAETGTLEVTASTSGDEPDPDGYEVTVDGSTSDSVGPNGTATFSDLSTGDHDVELSGTADNCSVQGDNPRTINVAFDSTTTTTFSVECQATTGDIEVSVSTAGDTTDPDGYEVTVDGGSATAVGPNGTTTFTDLSEGSHDVELSGIQVNCSPGGGNNPKTVSVTAGQTTSASFSVDCEAALFDRIVFGSDRNGNNELYAMGQDGSDPVRLTSNSDLDHEPAISPDGTRIAFVSDRDGNSEIYVMDLDGRALTRVTNNSALDDQPSWSPDGSRIAFRSLRDGNFNLYAVDPDGGNLTRVVSDGDYDSGPSWTPEGKILFASNRDGDFEIYRVNADGSGLEKITDNTSAEVLPSAAPDGSRIVFVQRDAAGGPDNEIFSMNPDGTGLVQLTDNSESDLYPVYSPDGSWIAFRQSDGKTGEIYRMDSDGTNLINLTNDSARDSHPSWSPFR